MATKSRRRFVDVSLTRYKLDKVIAERVKLSGKVKVLRYKLPGMGSCTNSILISIDNIDSKL